ncbi:hypothetical protein DFH08DRAFT_1051508 [Mycena albidolilacea]|uniref:Uncharacterized protein n=1 Tax=Mycena albidolilacea TaxID=1033008 RepID=A0AAD6Z5L4_9AGAR|nr:hypothetical protein DFH08DRAFT_1051508 [Mycena albidolilacea]
MSLVDGGALVNPTAAADLRVSTSPSAALACHVTGSLLVQRGLENFEESVKDGLGIAPSFGWNASKVSLTIGSVQGVDSAIRTPVRALFNKTKRPFIHFRCTWTKDAHSTLITNSHESDGLLNADFWSFKAVVKLHFGWVNFVGSATTPQLEAQRDVRLRLDLVQPIKRMSRSRLFLVLFFEQSALSTLAHSAIKPLSNFKMFSKIVTVGLAALTFVGAAPATDFQAPMAISCNFNVPVNFQSDICRHDWLIGARSGESAFLSPRNAPKDGTPVNLGTAIRVARASAAAYSLEPGAYRILDVPTNTWLRDYNRDGPVFVSLTREWPGDFAVWKVEEAQDGAVIISNIGLGSPVYAGNDKAIIAGYERPPVPFAIESAGDDTFVIKSVFEDLVWTRKNPGSVRSEVQLRPANGDDSQKWRFIRLNN